MANLITLSRLGLLALVTTLTYMGPHWALVNVALLMLMFATDGLDGYVARRLKETSQFGAVFDIACDRIVELCLWMLFVDLELVPAWVLVIVVVRGAAVDSIRTQQAAEHGKTPFSTIQSDFGRFMVASKTMRFSYAALKAMTFCVLMVLYARSGGVALPGELSEGTAATMANGFVGCSVLMCVLRGMPVIGEFVYSERRSLLGSLATSHSGPSG